MTKHVTEYNEMLLPIIFHGSLNELKFLWLSFSKLVIAWCVCTVVTSVLFLNNFTLTMGFYWSYTLLL